MFVQSIKISRNLQSVRELTARENDALLKRYTSTHLSKTLSPRSSGTVTSISCVMRFWDHLATFKLQKDFG